MTRLLPILLTLAFLCGTPASAQLDAHVVQEAKPTAAPPQAQDFDGLASTAKLGCYLSSHVNFTANGDQHNAAISFGCGAATDQEGVIRTGSQNNLSTTSLRTATYNNRVASVTGFNGGANSRAEHTSLDADGTTITWQEQTSAVAVPINALLLGGADITNAAVKHIALNTMTGAQAYAHGFGFQPDLVILLHSLDVTPGSDHNQMSFGVGAWAPGGNQWAVTISGRNGTATAGDVDYKRWQSDDACLLGIVSAGGTAEMDISCASIDGTNITLTQNDAPSSAWDVVLIGLAGGSYAVGSTAKTTSGAPVTQQVVSTSFAPDGALFATINDTTDDSIVSDANIGIGFGSSATAFASVSVANNDDALNTQSGSRMSNTMAIMGIDRTSVSANTLEFEGDIDSMDADGITLNFTTNNASADIIHWVAFGDAAGSIPVITSSIMRKKK